MNPVFAKWAIKPNIQFVDHAGQLLQNLQFQKEGIAYDTRLAMDAQPDLITTSNAGIPFFLLNYIDPKLIEVLVSPMKAAEIVANGEEVQKGDWTTKTAMFPVIESTGSVTTYGDHNNNGQSNANANWVSVQAYKFQTITAWGEEELAIMAEGRIDWANRLNISSILALNKFQNKSYFFGVQGVKQDGLLNSPSLSKAITPNDKSGGGKTWEIGTGKEIFLDIQLLYGQLQTQSNGLVTLDTQMTLAMSPNSEKWLTKTTDFNVNVFDNISKNFPNMKVKTAPEYATQSGELVQLIVNEYEGQRTVDVAFTTKLRAHPVIVEMSAFKQKKSQTTLGAIIYRPMFIAQMLGV